MWPVASNGAVLLFEAWSQVVRDAEGEVVSVTVDGSAQADMTIKLIDDGATHEVVVVIA